MDMLEFKYDEILKSKKIDNVSKDLLKILLNKQVAIIREGRDLYSKKDYAEYSGLIKP